MHFIFQNAFADPSEIVEKLPLKYESIEKIEFPASGKTESAAKEGDSWLTKQPNRGKEFWCLSVGQLVQSVGKVFSVGRFHEWILMTQGDAKSFMKSWTSKLKWLENQNLVIIQKYFGCFLVLDRKDRVLMAPKLLTRKFFFLNLHSIDFM